MGNPHTNGSASGQPQRSQLVGSVISLDFHFLELQGFVVIFSFNAINISVVNIIIEFLIAITILTTKAI